MTLEQAVDQRQRIGPARQAAQAQPGGAELAGHAQVAAAPAQLQRQRLHLVPVRFFGGDDALAQRALGAGRRFALQAQEFRVVFQIRSGRGVVAERRQQGLQGTVVLHGTASIGEAAAVGGGRQVTRDCRQHPGRRRRRPAAGRRATAGRGGPGRRRGTGYRWPTGPRRPRCGWPNSAHGRQTPRPAH